MVVDSQNRYVDFPIKNRLEIVLLNLKFKKFFKGKAPALEELDPNTLEYWKRVRKLGRRRVNYLKSVKPF